MSNVQEQIWSITYAVQGMTELENQDQSLIIEMSQRMLNDLAEYGRLRPLTEYVKRYCDVYDSPEHLQEIVSELTRER